MSGSKHHQTHQQDHIVVLQRQIAVLARAEFAVAVLHMDVDLLLVAAVEIEIEEITAVLLGRRSYPRPERMLIRTHRFAQGCRMHLQDLVGRAEEFAQMFGAVYDWHAVIVW